MNKMIVRLWMLVFMGVFASNLRAEATWSSSTCAPADWVGLSDNLLSGMAGTIFGSTSSYGSTDPGLLTDGSVPPGAPCKACIVGFQNSSSIAWSFSTPKNLDSVRVSCGYLDGASFSGFTVSKIEVKDFGSSEWREITTAEGGMSSNGKTEIHMAVFAEDGGAPLAEGIGGLRVTFGAAPVGFANYCAEIEAVGSAQATGPVVSQINVTPARTKAKIVGSLADVGTDATSCDVYLSLNAAESVKIAEGVTSSFEYQLQDLTLGTEYSYELTFENDAATPKQTKKSGAFTTLSASDPTVLWTKNVYMPDAWQALSRNMLLGNKGTMDPSHSPNGYGSSDLGVLSDGSAPTAAGKDWIVGISKDSEITWTFAEPVTLEYLRISSAYLADPHYSGVNIASVSVRCEGSDEWVELQGSASGKVAGDGTTKNIICATMSDVESGCLALNVTALKVVFGAAVYANANYYAEVEAVGRTSAAATAPELADPQVVTPTAVKAIVSDSVTNLGHTASRASLSFAYGTDPDVLGKPVLLTDNAVVDTVYSLTLTDLTPGATYYYEFSATNDVVETAATKTGQFTMPELVVHNCSLSIPAGTVSVKLGETTYTESTVVPVPEGESVSLRAIPAAGYVFERWTGDVAASQVSANPLVFVMGQSCGFTPVVRLASESKTATWLGGDGAWEDATKWNGGFVPTSSDVVEISSGTCTAVEQVSVKSLSLSSTAKLAVATMNGGHYGNLTVAGDLVLSDSAELSVAAGPLSGDQYTFATGSGFVTVGGTFEIKDTAKFVPCCDQYTGGGVVTKAVRFILASGASVEAISKGWAWFADRIPNSCAWGSPTGSKANNGWWGASYGGQGDTYGGGSGVRGQGGVEPYGFANAPVHPGSHKYNEQNKDNDPRAGGGNVRIHATRVSLAGKIDVTTTPVVTSGAPSGGGIWITATQRLKVHAAAQLLAKGGDSAWFGNANGGGGRIAFGVRLTDGEIAALAASGELPEGSRTVVRGEEEFFADYPDVMISLEGGKANNHEDEPLEVCRGSFRYLVGRKPGMVLVVQ